MPAQTSTHLHHGLLLAECCSTSIGVPVPSKWLSSGEGVKAQVNLRAAPLYAVGMRLPLCALQEALTMAMPQGW